MLWGQGVEGGVACGWVFLRLYVLERFYSCVNVDVLPNLSHVFQDLVVGQWGRALLSRSGKQFVLLQLELRTFVSFIELKLVAL